MKTRNKILFSVLPVISSVPVLAASCSGNEQKTDKKVIFSMAHSKTWPLPLALNPLIDYYNDFHKNEKGFIKVEPLYAETTKIYKEFDLIKDVKQNIETGEISKLPNLILGAQASAYILNQGKDLLDLNSYGVNKALFSTKIANLHAKLAGQDNTDKIYNIPFDNADTDALLFNLDLMNLIFELIKQGGGQVDEASDIYLKALEASKKGNDVPTNSIFKALKVKENAFKDWKVNDETFKSIESIRKFSKKFHDGVELDSSKINKKTIDGEVLSIDYQDQVFIKELTENNKNKSIFSLEKTNDKNEPTKVKYNIVTDEGIKSNFTNLWNSYKDTVARQEFTEGESKHSFYSIKYMKNQLAEWGNWDILQYKTAISFAASVGANMSKQTVWAHKYFVELAKAATEEQYKTFSTDDDVLLKGQVLSTGKKVFSEGGSSLIPIKSSDNELNDATAKFVKWLYNGKNDLLQKGKMEDNWKTFAKTSGYIIPLKSVINEDGFDWINQEITNLTKSVKENETKLSTLDEKQKAKWVSDSLAINYLKSAKVSLESMLLFEKENDIVAVDNALNDKTSSIMSIIDKELLKQTNKDKEDSKSAEEMIEAFKTSIAK
ncbi:P68 family surface lipoprotein [Mycoplasma zalophidermidis]|uniref:Mycoplasma lipoprotein C-terminal domain-containing protein n=1 Tax=Mycoplasma zalophidermidis TaxID=398174 RepID=A0ABS6DSX5_9MOLU|nr:hypothetical protein [Mycoplasma zalophidermidis]MBU4689631.1 hypothetical protein [Mycoplasma zalophidermidis]MBU4693529.1 hypothetical protein [Mycoplasma zalophidermidis]MCR8966511.1 hypothetical protein [Mycoplasma zalophidermidis]